MQKHHSEPAVSTTAHIPAGGMKHSRLKSRGFTWPYAQARALAKQKQRSIQLATCNPDYQIEHPNECRDNPDKKCLHECHPEAAKRIEKKHELIVRKAQVPEIVKPARLNRIVG